jgi:hypothetical protein
VPVLSIRYQLKKKIAIYKAVLFIKYNQKKISGREDQLPPPHITQHTLQLELAYMGALQKNTTSRRAGTRFRPKFSRKEFRTCDMEIEDRKAKPPPEKYGDIAHTSFYIKIRL